MGTGIDMGGCTIVGMDKGACTMVLVLNEDMGYTTVLMAPGICMGMVGSPSTSGTV
jgi:hypothetical protein